MGGVPSNFFSGYVVQLPVGLCKSKLDQLSTLLSPLKGKWDQASGNAAKLKGAYIIISIYSKTNCTPPCPVFGW